jgi:hypothetical protein
MILGKCKYVQYNVSGAAVAMCGVQMSLLCDTSVNSTVVVTVRDYVCDTGGRGG